MYIHCTCTHVVHTYNVLEWSQSINASFHGNSKSSQATHDLITLHSTRRGQHHHCCYLSRYGERASVQMVCSARVSQNSHASRATVSLASCVRSSMYCEEEGVCVCGCVCVRACVCEISAETQSCTQTLEK